MKLCDRPYGYSEYREIGGYVHASIQSEHSEPLVLAIFLMAANFSVLTYTFVSIHRP
jgi:hypothetical protein